LIHEEFIDQGIREMEVGAMKKVVKGFVAVVLVVALSFVVFVLIGLTNRTAHGNVGGKSVTDTIYLNEE
jgi:hypothetical protein